MSDVGCRVLGVGCGMWDVGCGMVFGFVKIIMSRVYRNHTTISILLLPDNYNFLENNLISGRKSDKINSILQS